VSNPSVTVGTELSEKQSLATRFSQIVAAFERSQSARADRVIRRFSYLGAGIPEDKQNTADVSNRTAAAPYQRSLMVGIPQ
jgi:hypothetical protein